MFSCLNIWLFISEDLFQTLRLFNNTVGKVRIRCYFFNFFPMINVTLNIVGNFAICKSLYPSEDSKHVFVSLNLIHCTVCSVYVNFFRHELKGDTYPSFSYRILRTIHTITNGNGDTEIEHLYNNLPFQSTILLPCPMHWNIRLQEAP